MTVEALRAELEASAARLADESRRADRRVEQEHERAREEADALRLRLEAAPVERLSAVQAALAQSADEIAQLQATVHELRAALEAARHDARAAYEAAERKLRAERDDMRATIAALREQLEACNAS